MSYRPEGSGVAREVAARRDIIFSSGAANTPKLLQISGIGPESLLRKLGVPIVLDLRGVGDNLQDHYTTRMVARVKGVETLNTTTRPQLAREIARWCIGRPSALAVSPSIAWMFEITGGIHIPDIQMMFTPASYMEGIPGLLDKFPGLTLGFYQQRPESRGYVQARSADALDDPIIQPNYLDAEKDRIVVVELMRLCAVSSVPATGALYRSRDRPRSIGFNRRRAVGFRAAQCIDRLPSFRNLQDGYRERSDRWGRRAASCHWRRGAAGCRLLNHANGRFGKYWRDGSDDRLKGRRHDRPITAITQPEPLVP